MVDGVLTAGNRHRRSGRLNQNYIVAGTFWRNLFRIYGAQTVPSRIGCIHTPLPKIVCAITILAT